MANEIRINTKAAESALRLLESVMQEWEQNREGIREALCGVMDSQQADTTPYLGDMMDGFAHKRTWRISFFMESFYEDVKAFLDEFGQADAQTARELGGNR